MLLLDQTRARATLGQFVDIGTATVTANGVETAANAVTEGSFYFASIPRPLAAINGRVLENDGRPVLHAGTDGGGVFRLDGSTWMRKSNGLTSQIVTALGVQGATLYAGTSGGGICISTDQGETWKPANNQLPPTLNVYAFAVSGKKVYAGSIYGVFVTEDQGQNWKQVNAGLLNTFVTGLAISGDQLYASTASGGVFVSRIP